MTDVTLILSRIESGDPQAAEQLLPLVYDELRRLAAEKLCQERPGQTVQTTVLVHEAYIRLADTDNACAVARTPDGCRLATVRARGAWPMAAPSPMKPDAVFHGSPGNWHVHRAEMRPGTHGRDCQSFLVHGLEEEFTAGRSDEIGDPVLLHRNGPQHGAVCKHLARCMRIASAADACYVQQVAPRTAEPRSL